MSINVIALLIITGVFAGGYGTIVGAGGGFIFVPALLLILKVKPAIAAGSGLVIVLINALSGTIGYAKHQTIDYKTGIIIAISALPGSLFGVWALHIYESKYFYFIFATILILLGLFLLVKNIKVSSIKETKKSEKKYLKKKWLIPLGLIMGVLSSYLGIGGGWLLVPILIYIFRFSTHFATATSIFSLSIYSTYGVVSQIFYDSIDWKVVLWGGLGIVIGSQIGVKVSQKISGKVIIGLLS